MAPASPRSSRAAASSVVAVEADEPALGRGREHLERSTARALSRGRLNEAERQQLVGR